MKLDTVTRTLIEGDLVLHLNPREFVVMEELFVHVRQAVSWGMIVSQLQSANLDFSRPAILVATLRTKMRLIKTLDRIEAAGNDGFRYVPVAST